MQKILSRCGRIFTDYFSGNPLDRVYVEKPSLHTETV